MAERTANSEETGSETSGSPEGATPRSSASAAVPDVETMTRDQWLEASSISLPIGPKGELQSVKREVLIGAFADANASKKHFSRADVGTLVSEWLGREIS